MPQAIHISPIDNVVVALHPIAKGTLVEVDGLAVTALEDIPQGHKMAVKPIKNGENVIKYGFPIGHATADAEPGTWMHTHNVHTNLSGEVEYSYNPAPWHIQNRQACETKNTDNSRINDFSYNKSSEYFITLNSKMKNHIGI